MNLLLVAIVVVLFFFGLKYAEIIKRKKEKQQTNPDLLKARKITFSKNFTIENNKNLIDKLINNLSSYDTRVAHSSANTAIIYTSNSGKSKFDGMINTPAEKMPLRIILKLQNNKLSVHMDEDYGFQLFQAKAKQIFIKKYQDAFEYYIKKIENL